MPITFSITCDTEEELKRVLRNILIQIPEKSRIVEGEAGTNKVRSGKMLSVGARKKSDVKRPVQLVPIVSKAVDEVIKQGKPFRTATVIQYIMKKHPDLNEKSVTTGVIKMLSASRMKWKTVKESVGRPYKLYMPPPQD